MRCALAGGKGGAVRTDLGFVAVWQPQNHVVDSSGVGGTQDRLAVRLFLETGDVFGDRALEELDVLGQIADVTADVVGAPLGERGAVEAHAPRPTCHTPTRILASEDLPEALGSITASACPALREKSIWLRTTHGLPGMLTQTFSTFSSFFGAGNCSGSTFCGSEASVVHRRS